MLFLSLAVYVSPTIPSSHANQSSPELTLLKPFTVTANESHDRVIQMMVPGRTSVAVAFSGNDIAIETHENTNGLSATVRNNGRTVIIDLNSHKDQIGTILPVHILTKEGRTHTIAIIPLGKNHKNETVVIKAVIKAN